MFLKLYFIALPVLFAIDIVWLVFVARKFYASQLGSLLKPDVNWLAAVIFYLIFIAGLVSFVIAPAVEKHSITHALGYGAFFGLVAYATYDLTNLATMKDFPLLVTIVDLAWGMFLSAAVSAITFLFAKG
jgi:uncharacterized membrane protein